MPDPAVMDALAGIGWAVVSPGLRQQVDQWAKMDCTEQAATLGQLRLMAEVLAVR